MDDYMQKTTRDNIIVLENEIRSVKRKIEESKKLEQTYKTRERKRECKKEIDKLSQELMKLTVRLRQQQQALKDSLSSQSKSSDSHNMEASESLKSSDKKYYYSVIKRNYSRQSGFKRFIAKISGKSPKWNKIQNYSTEKLEHLADQTREGNFDELLRGRTR